MTITNEFAYGGYVALGWLRTNVWYKAHHPPPQKSNSFITYNVFKRLENNYFICYSTHMHVFLNFFNSIYALVFNGNISEVTLK